MNRLLACAKNLCRKERVHSKEITGNYCPAFTALSGCRLMPALCKMVFSPAVNKIMYRILRNNNITPNITTFTGGVVLHLRHLRNMSIAS